MYIGIEEFISIQNTNTIEYRVRYEPWKKMFHHKKCSGKRIKYPVKFVKSIGDQCFRDMNNDRIPFMDDTYQHNKHN